MTAISDYIMTAISDYIMTRSVMQAADSAMGDIEHDLMMRAIRNQHPNYGGGR